jgi:hypothetical protein
MWRMAANMCFSSALEACTILWFKMTFHTEGGWCIPFKFVGNTNMGLSTKMSQLGHYETIRTLGNVHWERTPRAKSREIRSMTMLRTT